MAGMSKREIKDKIKLIEEKIEAINGANDQVRTALDEICKLLISTKLTDNNSLKGEYYDYYCEAVDEWFDRAHAFMPTLQNEEEVLMDTVHSLNEALDYYKDLLEG